MTVVSLPAQYELSNAGVTQALVALGSTPTEVAETLRSGGYRGHRGCEGICPVAMYLSDMFPDTTPCVDIDDVTLLDVRGGMAAEVDLPDAVAGFVAAFDAGRLFGDLVDAGTEVAS